MYIRVLLDESTRLCLHFIFTTWKGMSMFIKRQGSRQHVELIWCFEAFSYW
jgi:hypothetical protein